MWQIYSTTAAKSWVRFNTCAVLSTPIHHLLEFCSDQVQTLPLCCWKHSAITEQDDKCTRVDNLGYQHSGLNWEAFDKKESFWLVSGSLCCMCTSWSLASHGTSCERWVPTCSLLNLIPDPECSALAAEVQPGFQTCQFLAGSNSSECRRQAWEGLGLHH